MKLFVYGTLMRGFHNNYMLEGSTFLGRAITSADYSLYASGIPFLTTGKQHVAGEVFEVNEHILRACDALEGHPNWYCRKPISLIYPQLDHVEAYLMPQEDVRGYPVKPLFDGVYTVQSYRRDHT